MQEIDVSDWRKSDLKFFWQKKFHKNFAPHHQLYQGWISPAACPRVVTNHWHTVWHLLQIIFEEVAKKRQNNANVTKYWQFFFTKKDFFAPLLHWGLDQVQESQVFLYLSCGVYFLYCIIGEFTSITDTE